MYIHPSNAAITCPESAAKTQNLKNLSESICSLKVFVTGKTIPGFLASRISSSLSINGCFWHAHEGCKYFVWPKNNEEFWKNKISGNIRRDADNYTLLEQMGWNVIVVWECQLKKHNCQQTYNLLCTQIKGTDYECNK